MILNNEYKDEILSTIKGTYGRSGGKCVTNAVYGVTNKDEVYKEVERLNYSECAMGSGYKIYTQINLDKNARKHIGVVSEQIVRLILSSKLSEKEKYKKCFLRQLRSAYAVGKLDTAVEMCKKITGNDNSSIHYMYLLSTFSDVEEKKNSIKSEGKHISKYELQKTADDELRKVGNKPFLYIKEVTDIISLCINRIIAYLTTKCKVRDFGVVLEANGNNIQGGEVDVVTKDSIVDIKVREQFTVYDVLQVLTYARIMKLNKHKLYRGIKYIKLVNPFTNKVRTYTIKSIPKEIWELIDDNIICTYKQLSLF